MSGGSGSKLDPYTGVVVPPRDTVALARAIGGLLANPERRRQMGRAAREKTRTQFSVGKMIDRHIRLYEELLNTHEQAA